MERLNARTWISTCFNRSLGTEKRATNTFSAVFRKLPGMAPGRPGNVASTLWRTALNSLFLEITTETPKASRHVNRFSSWEMTSASVDGPPKS